MVRDPESEAEAANLVALLDQFHPFLFVLNDLAGWAWSGDWVMDCSNDFHSCSIDATV